MPFQYKVSEDKKVRVIIDTDQTVDKVHDKCRGFFSY